MSDFRSRLMMEQSELDDKLNKLKAFILSDKFGGLPEIEQVDLKEQLKYMEGYLDILMKRCSRLLGNS